MSAAAPSYTRKSIEVVLLGVGLLVASALLPHPVSHYIEIFQNAQRIPDDELGYVIAWATLAFGLLIKLLTFFRGVEPQKRSDAPAIAQRPRDGFEAVTWLLPCAASSPSRIEAQRNLPEYAARLLERVETRV